MFGLTRRAVCCLLGLLAMMAALAQPAHADKVTLTPDLECGVGAPLLGACEEELAAGVFPGPEYTRRFATLLKFDLTGELPVGAEVLSATLHLTRESDNAGGDDADDSLSVFAMETAFSGSDDWYSLGGDSENNPGTSDAAVDTIVPHDGPNRWDVSSLVRDWYTSALPNYGLAVADHDTRNDGAQRSVFYDSGAGNAAVRPSLEIEYFIPCPSDPYTAAQSSSASKVYAWNDVLLDAMRAGGPPTRLSRAAAMMHVGIYDTFNSVFFAKLEALSTGNPTANQSCGWEPYVVLAETGATTDANLAAGFAAKNILTSLFPARTSQIATAFTTIHGAGPYQSAAQSLGEFVAAQVLANRASDGSTASMSYTLTNTAGAWRPSPNLSTPVVCESVTDAVTPGWGNVTPFTLSSGSQYRPPLPEGETTYSGLLSTFEYIFQFEEVKALGAVSSSTRGSDRTFAAWFWANDLDGTYKPPGQLLQHTKEVAMTQPAAITTGTADEFFSEWSQQGIRVSHLFAEVSLAMADAAIAAWDAKYNTAIDLWRPYDAIRGAATDGNSYTTADSAWEPLSRDFNANPLLEGHFSPCFPAWVSGHATFGGAWSRTLENEFAGATVTNPFPLTLTSEDPHAKRLMVPTGTLATRAFSSFEEAGFENAESRIWLGVHWRWDAEAGVTTGRNVADHVEDTRVRPAKRCVNWACTVPITP